MMSKELSKIIKVEVTVKPGCKVLDIPIDKIDVKYHNSDIGGNFYIYDMYANGTLIAKNRYCYKDSEKQPFNKLTVEDELILNPPPDPEEPMKEML